MQATFLLSLGLIINLLLSTSVRAEGFSEASFIAGSDKTFSAYPASEMRMARTARVWVSYMVKADGSVAEPMIEQINNERFKEQILKWMKARKYEPATLDGKPTDSWLRDRFGFNIGYDERSPHVSTKLFNKYYANFGGEMQKPEPDPAKLQKWLSKMAGAKHGSPLAYEFLSNARYRYAAKFGDRTMQIKALREMILSNDRGMAMANGVNADQELIRLLIEAGYYGETVEAYYSALRKHSNDIDDALRQLFRPTIQQIEEIINSDKAFARDILIDEAEYTFLPVSKKHLAIEEVNGSISSLKFRCEKKFAELPLTIGAEYKLPESWGVCQLQVLGAPNTKATLIQY